MMSSGLLHQLKIYNSQPVLQNGVAGFERRGHLGGSQALMKDATLSCTTGYVSSDVFGA